MTVSRGTYSTHGQQHLEQAQPIKNGEQALWRAVIERALDDACGHCGGEGNYRNRVRNTDTAAAWLLNVGRDMRFVCDLADLNPQSVKNRAAAEIARTALIEEPKPRKRLKNVRHVRSKWVGQPPT